MSTAPEATPNLAPIQTPPLLPPRLDAVHHVAIPSTDIAASVAWYCEHFACKVAYQDETWALLKFANVQLAFVRPEQHPPHIAFVASEAEAATHGPLTPHRDGTRSIYVSDVSGNQVEYLVLPSLPLT